MKTTLQIKLLPTLDQYDTLKTTMRVFNRACDVISRVAFERKCFSKFALQKFVYSDIRKEFGLSAQMTIRAIGKVCDSYKTKRTTLHQFKPEGAVCYDQRIMSFHGLEIVNLWTLQGRLNIPIQMGAYQKAAWHRGKGQADLTLRNGTFYLLVAIETPEPPPIDPKGYLGVDLGIVQIATDSDGAAFSGAKVEAVRQHYFTLRQNLQKCGTRSAKRHLKRSSGKEALFRRDTNHCIAKKLVAKAKDTCRGIALEDLTGIRERTTVRKSQRAKRAGWSFFQLRSLIQYKALLAGVPVVLVDPRNTSRQCSVPSCGHIDKGNRKTQASFVCLKCGHSENADVNAAKNIASKAAVNLPIVAGTGQGLPPSYKPTALAVGS